MPTYVLWCRDCHKEREVKMTIAQLDRAQKQAMRPPETRSPVPGRCGCGSFEFRVKPSAFTFSIK